MLAKHAWVLPAALTLVAGSAYADMQQMGRMAPSQSINTTVVFKLRHEKELARFIQNASRPGPQFHKFLTTEEFKNRFGPKQSDVQRVMRYAKAHGLSVTKRYKNGMALKLSASASQYEQAFGVRLANYKQRGTDEARARFHKPMSPMQMPAELSDSGVLTVSGLSNERKSHPLHTNIGSNAPVKAKSIQLRADQDTINEPGELTTNDVAKLYNATPLYQRGVTGKGVTLGIATYADFEPADAEIYWALIGLDTKPDRIEKIAVNGGGEFGPGTGETSLDVEQAGGLAPAADIRVYVAPNSNSGTLALFNQIVSENAVDTLSYSWGIAEPYSVPAIAGPGAEANLLAQNQLFMEAAAQGISIFVASGDAGGYDINRGIGQFSFPGSSKLVSVDSPSVSSYVTAAGGTTLPFQATYYCAAQPEINAPIRITEERAWSYDYFSALAQRCGASPSGFGVFPGGAGGGVSVLFPIPPYQQGISGMNKTPFNQGLLDYNPVIFYGRLPGGYAGRNVPDISMNADPYTGYISYVSSQGGLLSGGGGTSYVAPQLNGLNALFNQDNGGRLGLLNPQLYRLFRQRGYGENSPFNDITAGSNWYWHARRGYDDAAGIGTPDAAKLSEALGQP